MSPEPTSRLSPWQAMLRFTIEMAALTCWAIAGWNMADSAVRWLPAIGLPIATAAVWGTFRTPGDESAGGEAPVAVPGLVRLGLELTALIGAAIAVAVFWRLEVGLVLAAAVVGHYVTTTPRIRWLAATGVITD